MRAILVLLTSLIFTTFALAEQKTADVTAAQRVITQQIEAFIRDDGATAYSFAAPNVKSIFPNKDVFLSMVKRGYRPVYRPNTFSFDEAFEKNGAIGQRVLITGDDGLAYEAFYQLSKQADGSWKISGVTLRKLPGAST